MKFFASILVIMLFLTPVFLVDYSGVSVSSVDPVDRVVTADSTGQDWLSGWSYRKSHLLLGSIGAGTDYQIMIIVHYGSGSDTGSEVYCDSLVNTDFSDIRFTDDDGITELDYWMEEIHESVNATFWVEVSDNLDTDQTIFVYFGNTMANSNSNGEATFVFFDDFDDDSIDADKWQTYGPWTESGGVTSFSIAGTGGVSVLPDLMSNDSWDMRNKSIVSRWRVNALTVNREWGVSCADTIGDDHTRLAYFLALNTSGNDNVRSYYDASDVAGYDYYNLIIGEYPPSVFMRTEFVSTPNNVTKNSWILDGSVLDTYSGSSFDSTPQRIFLGFYVHGYTNTLVSGNLEMEFDWVYLRNQVGTEPIHGSWESIESEPDDGLSWLSGWEFRKSHSIEGSSGAGHDYQVKIVVHFGAGVDTGNEVYCNTYCLSNFGDIFFTDNDGITELSYWMEESHDSYNATFWVKLQDTLDHDQSIYVYYGNPDQLNVSDGESTFIAWDDFDLGYTVGDSPKTSRGWSVTGQGSTDILEVSPNPTGRGGNGLRYVNGEIVDPAMFLHNEFTQELSVALHLKLYWDVRDGQFRYNILDIDDEGSSVFTWSNYVSGYNLRYRDSPTTNLEYTPAYELLQDVWYNIESQCEPNAHSLIVNDATLSGTVRLTGDGYDYIYIYGHEDQLDDFYIDDFFIRKYTSSEPVHGAWGSMESALSLYSSDLIYEAGTIGNTIMWSAFSYHPSRYLRYVNDALLVNSSWDGSDIQVSVDGLTLGVHNLTLQIFNTLGYSLTSNIFVTVEDTTDPVLSHPDDIEFLEGTQGNSIEWTMSDLYPDSYELHIEGELIFTGAWNTTEKSLSISVDGLLVGIYNFSLTAIDESGNTAVDYVTVTIVSDYTYLILMSGVVMVVFIIGVICLRSKKS